MSQHAKLAPSACSRWSACPGSIALSEVILEEHPGDKDGSPAARRGSYLHFLSEQVLQGELALADLATIDPLIMKVHHHPPNQEEIDIIALYVGTVEQYQRDMGEGTRCGIEVQLRSPKWHRDIWGTADAVLIGPNKKHLVLIDLKSGYHGVSAEDNDQLLCYAALAVGYYKIAPETVEMVIVQPRARDGLPAVRTSTITFDELMHKAAMIKHSADLALSPEGAAIYRPGVKQCQWCPAAGQCTAQVKSQAVSDFFDGAPPTALMGEEQIGEMLDQIEEVDQYINQLRATAHKMAMRGTDFPGWKIVHKRTIRKWEDKSEVLGILMATDIDRSLYIDEVLKSFTKVLKVPEAAALIDHLVIKPVGELQLAPESDPRPEAEPGDDFE